MGFEFGKHFNGDPSPEDIDKIVMDFVCQFGAKNPELIRAALARWGAPESHDIAAGFKYGMWFAMREMLLGHLKIVIMETDPESENT